MSRTLWTTVAIVVALLTLPDIASARSGWKLPEAKSKQGKRVFTSTAWTCGQRQFGRYRFKNAVRVRGRRGHVIFRVRIAADGSLHRPRFVRFGGRLPKKLRQRTRKVLRQTRYRYRSGPTPLVESRWRKSNRLQASRPFDPVRVRRARC